ncbi:lysM domain-containing GPI-anchored protein 2 isoform X1 [Quercus robur]|uniref:lysM domain-containing GPI-anchored protein 2 isoform X1 n=1 Tax=Quercus robur TaxID=38942 RepID=UPI0021615C5C|nr:lysM domain-containing GPI-anchored protein 2 isoform X1 [Quercus robur]
MGYAKVLVGVLFLFIAVATTSAAFTCTTNTTTTTNSTCRSLIDYVPLNNTNLSAVQSLFQIKRFHDLLGANDFSNSTSPNQTLPAKQRIKIPFSCRCENGTGVSDKPPVYTVKEGDVGLYNITSFTFSNVVTYQEIAEFNRLPDPNKITVGQKLSIPLPCSCDEVEGVEVVHYGHVVESGSSVEKIATEYGTTPAILLKLNGMANASQLQADQVLDVPLRACNSSVNSSSLDYPLLVANGTYVYTANDCVNCKCSSANNYILQCEASVLKPSSKTWSTCPAMHCNGTSSLYLGNVTTSTNCNQTFCAYSGFTNKDIFTTLATESTCPAGGPTGSPTSSPGSDASKTGMQGFRWNFLFISIQLIFLCFTLS